MSQTTTPLRLFVSTAPGIEPLAAQELAGLGIRGAAAEPGGVAWEGGPETMHAACLHLRTASRVLVRAAEFRARTFFELERHARRVPWSRFLRPGSAVRLRVTARKSKLYHEGAIAERLVRAMERAVGDVRVLGGGGGEDDDEESLEGQTFVIRFLHDRCTLSADASGTLLHQRGYRQALAKAPLRETLAAALLHASDWDPAAPLLDPMCGAGTLPIEAALRARRIAPGLAAADREPRAYAFQQWDDFDPAGWQRVVERARDQILPRPPAAIHGSDRDAGAITAARANAERAGVLDDLVLTQRPLSAADPPPGAGWLVTNPPYGVRVGETRALRDLYAALGRLARTRLPGWTVCMLSADRALEAQTGLALRERLQTRNGGIPVRVVAAELPTSP